MTKPPDMTVNIVDAADDDMTIAEHGAQMYEAEALIDVLRISGKSPGGAMTQLLLAIAIMLVDHPPTRGHQATCDNIGAVLMNTIRLVQTERADDRSKPN